MNQPKHDLPERTFNVARRVVNLCQMLDQTPGISRTLANQLLRSGTSIGANVEEAQAGQSRADFINKLFIACQEARETHYWLRLVAATELIPEPRLTEFSTRPINSSPFSPPSFEEQKKVGIENEE